MRFQNKKAHGIFDASRPFRTESCFGSPLRAAFLQFPNAGIHRLTIASLESRDHVIAVSKHSTVVASARPFRVRGSPIRRSFRVSPVSQSATSERHSRCQQFEGECAEERTRWMDTAHTLYVRGERCGVMISANREETNRGDPRQPYKMVENQSRVIGSVGLNGRAI